MLKQSLETHRWWSGVAGLDVAAAGEDLKELADRLPEEQWRIYTAAWRRLQGCIRRYDAIKAELPPGHSVILQPIDLANLQFLLATFVTVDEARSQLQDYGRDDSTQEVPLGQICLTNLEISTALDQASHLVNRRKWEKILQSSASDPPQVT